MAGSYNAGSVNAKVTLDDEEFKKKVEEMKKFTEQFANQAKQSSEQLQASMANTESTINNLVDSTKKLKEGQQQLYGTSANLSDSIKQEAENIKKLSQESKNAVKNVDEVAKANDRLSKSMEIRSKQAKLMTTDLEKAFTTDLHDAISKAEKLLGGKAVGLKPIFDDLSKKYSSQFGGVDKFNEKFFASLKAMGGYYQNIKRFADKITMVDVGKATPMNFINIENLSTAKELEENLKGVVEAQTEVATATKKATEAEKENIQATKQRIAINKQIATLQTDPKKQAQFNKELYDYLTALADPELGMGKKGVTLKRIKKEFADFTDDAKELEALIANAVHAIHAPIKNFMGEGRATFWIRDLKEPIAEVTQEVEKSTDVLKKETEVVKQNTLSYKENLAVRDAMLTQAYSFLSKSARLKGGLLNDIVGQDGGRWVDKGILDEDFRVRMFDLERFRKNIQDTFKGIIPTEQLKENLKALEEELELGHKFTGNFDGIFDYNYDYLKGQIQGIDYSLEELIEKFKEVETKEDTLSESTDKLTEKNKENAESIKQMVEANKELLASLKEVDLEAQLKANRKAYSMMKSYQHNTFETPYDLFRLALKDYHYSDEENEKLVNHAIKEMNAKVVDDGDELRVVSENLKKPILDIIDLENKLAENSGKIVNAKKHEAEEFRKYTMYELDMLQFWNSEMGNLVVDGTSLFPIDVYRNRGGHESEYFKNYSSILNSIKRNGNWIDRGRKNKNIYKSSGLMLGGKGDSDITKFVQRRLVELASDLGVTVSDVIDKEYKKVRSKLSGKMVEYLDVSNLTPERKKENQKWIDEARGQLYEVKRFEDKIEEIIRNYVSSKKLRKFGLADLKKEMDKTSTYGFENYGRNGNPYIKDYIQKNDLNKYYKEAQKLANINEYYELNYGRNPLYITRKISDGMRSLERVLRQTTIDWENLNAVEEKTTNTAEKLSTEMSNVANSERQLVEVNQVITASNEQSLSVLRKLIENYAELGVLQKGMLQQLNGVNLLDKLGNSYENYVSKDNLVKTLNQTYGTALKTVTTTLDPDFYIFRNLELAIEGITPLIWDYKTYLELTEGTTLTFKEATLKLSESLEKEDAELIKVSNDAKKVNTELSKTQQFINGMKEAKYGFGFIGEDARDTRYIRNTLRALKDPTGIAKIVPKDKDIRKYTNAQKDFLYKFYDKVQRLFLNVDRIFSSDLKIPTEKDLNSRHGIGFPFQNDYLLNYSEIEDGYKQFVKDTQTDIIKLLKDLNVEISTELSNAGKRIRVWNEELGKYQNIGSLDISKMLDLGNIDEFQAVIDKATIYDENLQKVAESIKKVGEAEKETVSPTKQITKEVKKVGEVAEYSATQLKILEDIYKQAQMVPFKSQGTYLNIENKYVKDLTGMSMGAVISPEKLRERFKREVQPLFTDLGIGFEARGRGEVPLLNIDNLISEKDFNRLIGKVEDLGAEIDKTALRTTKLGYALKETLTEFEENVNIVRWGTEKEFEQATTNFRKLMNGLMPLYEVTEKTEKSVDKLKRGLELIGKTSRGISKEGLVFGDVIAGSINKATGEITPFTVKLKDASEKIKQVGASEEATTKSTVKMGNAIKNIIKLVETEGKTFYGGTAPIGEGRIRFIDETSITDAKTQADLLTTMIGNAKTQAESLKATLLDTSTTNAESIGLTRKEIEQLSIEYRKVSESAQYFGMSAYQAYANIIPATIKAREELLKLGEAQQLPVKLIQMPDISGKAKSPLRYLNLYKGQILNILPYIHELESRAVNAFEKIKQKSSETKRVIVDDLEAGHQMSRRVFEDWKNGTAQLVVYTERLPVAIKKVSEAYEKAGETGKKFERQSKESVRSIDRYYNNIFRQLHHEEEELQKKFNLKPFNTRNLKEWNLWGDGIMRSGETLANTTRALKTFDNTVLTTSHNIKEKLVQAMMAFREIAQISRIEITEHMTNSWRQAIAEIEGFEKRYRVLSQRMYDLSRGRGYWQNKDKQPTGYGTTLNDLKYQKEVLQYIENGMLMAGGKFYDINNLIGTDKIDLFGKKGRINVEGYSDYVARINEIKISLEGAYGNSERFKQSLVGLADAIKRNNDSLTGFVGKSEQVIKSLTQMAEANERFNSFSDTGSPKELDQLVQRLEHFSGLTERNKTALKGLSEQARILRNSFEVVTQEFKQGQLSEEAYDREIKKLTADLKNLGTTATEEIRKLNLVEPTKLKDANNELKKGKESLNEFGKAMNNQEKYVDNLYRGLQKARSVIISIKTILRMMGGMAVWNFAFEMVESAKQTYKSKNEMESLLNQNKKIDASGIQYFNKQLDETAEKFQKINKYSLGETATSIGLEFDLNAKEMGKSLDIIAMIQSEYVRAGRTVDEAGLAVKDILQGEFMRLSRETGVGKQELIEAGWSGDNKDVMSLLNALDKVGKSRHWDDFAKKATSLNDVLTITQSRFSELGAEIGTVAEPLIVGAFNSILGAVETLKKGFEGLGGFGKHFSLALGGTVAIKGLVTGYLMLAKNMGVLEIATHGLTKSLFMNLLQLNRNDVALHGFWKTLIATISGTEASTVANIGAKKSFVARVLGVNQTIVAEQGLKHAMVENVFRLKETEEAYKKVNNITGKHINLEKASILSKEKSGIVTSKLANLELSRSQKLAYLTTNMKYAEVANLGTGKALLKTATSARVLLGAFKALSVVGIVTWFASVASWTDTVSKRMEKYNKLLQEGKQEIKDARKTYEDWNSKLEGMSESDPKYSLTSQNAKTAKANLDDLEMANTLAKSIKKNSKEVSESHDLMLKTGLNNIYDENGLNVLEKGGQEYQQMKYVAYDIAHAEEERYKFEYASLQHINEYTNRLKEAGVDEEKRVKYITEYSTKAQEVAENLKKFNEGDITAGMYYVLGKLQLMWTDLWYDEHFLNFWESLKKTWNDLQPTVNQLVKSLGDLGHVLLDFFSTSQGQIVGGAMVIGGAIAIIGYKVAPTLKKLKDFGSTLKDVLGKIKDWKRESGSDKSPTGDKEDTPSTGGTTGDVGGKGNGKFWGWDGQMGGVLKNRALSFVNNALLIAEGMALMTEAIYMLQAPMWALAETGKTFKAKETSIRAGIEGLQLIAPTFIAILVPIVALMKIMDMWGSQIMNIKTIGATAIGIALGIGLVTEAIIMLKAPMWALSEIGKDFSKNKMNMENAITAINTMAESLKSLASFIPAFLVGIALMAVAFAQPEVGALAIGATVIGIALGMVLLTEAIVTLRLPLEGIAQLGNSFTDIEGAKKGAEAIKVTAEAMKYVSEAFGYLVTVQWDILKSNIAQLLGVDLGTTLDDLVKDDDGFLPKLSKFAEKFNSMEFTPIQEDKAQALKTTAEGLNSINDALKSATDAINNLPAEFKNGGNGQPLLSYDMETATTEVQGTATLTGGESSYFDQLKQPLEELGKFIKWFNEELSFPTDGVDTDKLSTITQSADMVTQINDAVNKVKETMGNIGMGNIATGFAQMTGGTAGVPSFGGIGASFNIGTAVGEFVTGKGGQGDYQSSIGGQLYEMELVLKDLATFNNNVSGLGGASGGGGGGAMQEGTSGVTQGLTDMVTAVSQAISTLESTLAQSVPNIKTNATNIGSGIREGIKTGMGDLTSLIVPPFVTALQSMKANASTYGKGVGYNLREGVKAEAKVKQVVEDEINYTIQYLDGQKQVFYDKGAMLGEAMASGLKEKGFKQQSPGLMARTTLQEMYYMSDALDEGMGMLPEKAIELGNIISTSFNPQLALGGLSVDDLSAFQSGLDTITYMANDTNMQTSTAFNNMNTTTSTTMGSMTTTVNGAFTNIDQNATTSYGRIVNTTRTSLKNMQDQTTKNIGAIRTSWHGMQTALIASAEQIRSETSSKIHQLESNMASFWNKIQNPANLLAGNPMLGGHTTPRHRPTGISSHSNGRRMLSAGNPALGQKVTGISDRFKAIGSDSKIRERFAEYLQCLLNGDMCVAGGGSGWNFNWSKEIQDVFMQWHTHFGEIYDPYLRVGKFENDDFPVRGIAPIALKYIEDAISRTSYDFYYNERYSPLEAWNRGAFNCVDGANLAIAFANAFGFTGGSLQYTTWDGIGHAYAYIPGLGVIDATAIQGGYGLTASKVSYSAGSHTIPQNKPSNSNAPNNETTINIGDINVHIEGDVENAKEKGKEIGEEINNRIYNMLRRNLGTGQ